MLMDTAIARFGRCIHIARALDDACFASAVYQWKKKGVVPLWAAQILHEKTGGELQIDPRLYDAKGRVIPQRSLKPKKKRKSS